MKYIILLLLLSSCAPQTYEISSLYTGYESGSWLRISKACAADLCAPESYK
jgi:hypothetical protein